MFPVQPEFPVDSLSLLYHSINLRNPSHCPLGVYVMPSTEDLHGKHPEHVIPLQQFNLDP